MNSIVCIHPIRSGLRSFKILINKLSSYYGTRFIYYKLLNNDISHQKSLENLKKLSNSFLIVLCHGLDNKILGCYYNTIDERNCKRYFNDKFIDFNNIDVFGNKIVFCFTCNSNIKIGRWAIENGAIAFISFGTIRFDYKKNITIYNEHLDVSVNNLAVVNKAKFEIREILLKVLCFSIDNNLSVYELFILTKLIINKFCDKLLFNKNDKYRHKKEIVRILQEISFGMKIYGNSNSKISV
jgi:hypothetical protein